VLPPALEAGEPPELRGLARDEVRLLVSLVDEDRVEHTRFRDLPRWLAPGDLLVVNTSATLMASLPACAERERFELHLSTEVPGGFWVVELREPGELASQPSRAGRPGLRLELPGAAQATLLAPYPFASALEASSRLWLAALELGSPLVPYLRRHGAPIRYSYVRDHRSWRPEWYQTVFATEPGSAEMPSAGRPFTAELVTALVARGIQLAPLLLHTGVASVEDHEPPYEEFYRVPAATADLVNAARQAGRRVIAVGTTVVRALETVTDDRGRAAAGDGWTRLVITPDRPLRAVTGLITGLHEPRATHLTIVEQAIAAAGGRRSHVDKAYAEALHEQYLWHEFGDSHLILRSARSDSRRAASGKEPER
jgi:S-adenosylmethionine:tRNA ribosyltransferase-isomerase